MSEEKIVKTACLFCPPGCGIDVHVKDNKPVKIEGMKESVIGPICIKGEMIPEWYETELKNRVLHPMKKNGIGWKQITWDEALDTIAEKLTKIKDEYGPEAFATFIGQVEPFYDWTYFVRKFSIAYGTPSYFSGYHFCYITKVLAGTKTYGAYGPPTLIGTKCIVLWAANPTGSVPFAGDAMAMARLRGTKLVVIDPRKTVLAKAADLWLQIRPGTDGALALAFLNVIIGEDLYEKEFVEKWTIGFDKLKEHVKQYAPEKVAEITWIPADKIREAARIYATNKPSTIFQGNCLDNSDNGFQGCRAICSLITVTGNVDARGGSTLIPIFNFSKWAVEDTPEEELPKVKPAGADEFRLFNEVVGQPVVNSMYTAILEEKPYPIKALFVQNGNPLISDADSNRQKRAYEKLDFMVTHDLFLTETGEYADIVLPSATFLEQQQVYQYVGRPMVVRLNKVIEPPEDCWPQWKVWFELAKRMGYEKHFPWKDIDEAENAILKRVNITMDDFDKNPGGVFHSERKWKRYETEGFKTESGKIELFSEDLEKRGIDPLPTYYEPAESSISRPDLARNFPLILITGNRSLYFLHSMQRSTPTLRAKDPEPMAEINTKTAGRLGIQSGDMIIIENQRGIVQMKAAVTADIHPQVVSLPHDWGRMANQNYLTSQETYDPAVGCPAMRAVPCRVRKAELSQAQEIITD